MLARRKVLLINSSAGLYGADRCLLWIVAGLIEKGFEVEVVLPFHGPLVAKLDEVGVSVNIVDPVVFRRNVLKPAAMLRLAVFSVPSLLRLCKLIKSNDFDLVHSNTGVIIGGALAARICGLPHVWHFREMLTEFRYLWKMHEWVVCLTSREIVCISSAVEKQFKSNAARSKTTVINDGIPLPKSNLAKKRNWSGNKCRLLTVGLIAPYKGQDVLIAAVKSLVEKGRDIDLTIVGGVFGGQTDFRNSLVHKVHEMGLSQHVSFEGFCENVEPYFDKADIFVLPSRRPEGLGLVILEAMARRVPVIATRGGGVTEIINDGENGVLVEAGDHVDLANAIKRVSADSEFASSLVEQGYTTVREKFSLERMITGLTGVYRRVLS